MGIQYIDIHTHRRKPDTLCMVSYSLGRDIFPTLADIPFSAGIHPWDAAAMPEQELERCLEFMRQAPLNAVGECGLDYIHGGSYVRQQEVFTAQLDIAYRRKLPVIIHCVKAYNDLLHLVKRNKEVAFILHGYIGSRQQTKRLLDEGCYFSIGPASLKSSRTVESVRAIPLEFLFAETDESDILIQRVYQSLAEVKKMQAAKILEQIQYNYNNLFSRNV